jgi:hypothetical protein
MDAPRTAGRPSVIAMEALQGKRPKVTRMSELIDEPSVDDAIDGYVDCGRSALSLGCLRGGRAGRRMRAGVQQSARHYRLGSSGWPRLGPCASRA